MTAGKHRVALIARADGNRRELAGYLGRAGFDVHECEELAVTTGFAALVVISAPDASTTELVDHIGSWLRSTRNQRVLVVTSRPTALTDLLSAHSERLHVLPAPAFGWDVVDRLRASQPVRPRDA